MRSTIANIRAEIARLRQALLVPEAFLEGSISGLEEAVRRFRLLERELSAGVALAEPEKGRLRDEVGALRNDLQRVAGLIAHGTALRQGWARLLDLEAACDAGYNPRGAAETWAGDISSVSVLG